MYVAVKTKTPKEVKNVIPYFTPITVTKDDKATQLLTRAIRIFQFFNDASKSDITLIMTTRSLSSEGAVMICSTNVNHILQDKSEHTV